MFESSVIYRAIDKLLVAQGFAPLDQLAESVNDNPAVIYKSNRELVAAERRQQNKRHSSRGWGESSRTTNFWKAMEDYGS